MSSKPTIKDLLARARQAIDNDEQFIYDVASETGSIVGNVKHMYWFRMAVNWINISTYLWRLTCWSRMKGLNRSKSAPGVGQAGFGGSDWTCEACLTACAR